MAVFNPIFIVLKFEGVKQVKATVVNAFIGVVQLLSKVAEHTDFTCH